jgi:hypothetical protein
MSDKPVPITLTGSYRGYQVSIQVDSTLDNLDKLVNRLQARGVEPLPTSQGAPAKKPLDVLEGTYEAHSFREPRARGPVARVCLRTADGRERWGDFWREEPSDILKLPPGARLRFYGREKPSDDGRYLNFSVSRWEQA